MWEEWKWGHRKKNWTASLFNLVERTQKLESGSKFLDLSSCRYDLDPFISCLWASCCLLCKTEIIILTLRIVRIKNNYIQPPAHSRSNSYYHCCWSNRLLWRRGERCSKIQNTRLYKKPERQMSNENEAKHCALMKRHIRKTKACKVKQIRGGRRMIWDI